MNCRAVCFVFELITYVTSLLLSTAPTPEPTVQPVSVAPVPASDCYTLDVTVTLDQYPPDTSWDLVAQGGSDNIASSPAYDASLALTPVTESLCLPSGTYEFTIYDVYADGM